MASVVSGEAPGAAVVKDGAPEAAVVKREALEDILSDLGNEVLTGCGPDEAFRPDYKSAAFGRCRPANAPTPSSGSSSSLFSEEHSLAEQQSFYFESDHLALKSNRDYSELLKTVVTLHAQRAQAIRDLDDLLEAKSHALLDPIGYVAKLQAGQLPEYPGPQSVAQLPTIDWTKYNVAQPDGNLRPQTRHAKQPPPQQPQAQADKPKVRGRVCDESKPDTFNKLWTIDEQRRLEQLLIEHPPEEVEMRRWTKIANALGNRTPKQVSSRVQKYFLKLTRAGLPIPGRGPKSKELKRNSGLSAKNLTKMVHKKSTFFPCDSLLDEVNKISEMKSEIKYEPSSTDDDLLCDFEATHEFNQAELLKEMKKEKDGDGDKQIYHHLGYKCYICEDQPIKGTRWHCDECLEEIDMCTDCVKAQHLAEHPLHPSTHKFSVIKPPQISKNYDDDYLPHNFNTTSYNYLDPNFLPE